tara:strand:- start:5412 stop:5906 length:495 start_codon:yes stop_codon:yes gene_type:complete
MARRARRRRSGGPSYEEVLAQIDAKEAEKKLKREEKQSADEFQFEEQVGDNRIEPVKDSIRDIGDPEDMMVEIMSVLNETVIIPDPGEVYTYVYNAKTPKLKYDQHPLVAVSGVYQWGFSGLNFHWNEVRNYTWNEIPGRLHLVRASELQSLLDIPYAYYLTNL